MSLLKNIIKLNSNSDESEDENYNNQFSQSFNISTPLKLDKINFPESLNNKNFNEQNVSLYSEENTNRESISNIDDIDNFIIPYKSKGDILEDSIIYQNNYSFINVYLNVLKSSKNVTTYPTILKFKLEINLKDFIFEEGNFFNYCKYNIIGKFNDGKEFSLSRRYSEFLLYRKLMVKNWPGLLIHPIPPKQTFGNLDDGFINLRKKFLQQFFNRICATPHLSSSNETKLFLDVNTEKFNELPFEIYERSLSDIYKIYSGYFNFLFEKDLTNKEKNVIQNFYLTLLKAKEKFESLSVIVTEAKNIQMEIRNLRKIFYENAFMTENSYYDFFNFTKEKKNYLNKNTIEVNLTEETYQIKYDNIYTTYFEWINSELINIDAMIEAISTIYKFNENFQNKIEYLKELNENLKNLTERNWINKFFFQLDLNEIQNKINQINQIKEDIEILKKLIDIIYRILYYIEIPAYKKDQYNFYINFVKKMYQDSEHETEKNDKIFKLFNEHCNNIYEVFKEERNKLKKKLEMNIIKEEKND